MFPAEHSNCVGVPLMLKVSNKSSDRDSFHLSPVQPILVAWRQKPSFKEIYQLFAQGLVHTHLPFYEVIHKRYHFLCFQFRSSHICSWKCTAPCTRKDRGISRLGVILRFAWVQKSSENNPKAWKKPQNVQQGLSGHKILNDGEKSRQPVVWK